MKIFFSVGEPSGDVHGANLIQQLRRLDPQVQAVGYGGPRMAAAGCRLHADLTQLAIMWFLQALLNLHKFLYLVCLADRYFREHRPDAVVLIDYPGFNWWIARRAKARGILVFYYGTPQMWAWAPWRVRKMKKLVDHVLCKLPFEAEWYRARDCRATFVGHPYFDELTNRRLDSAFLQQQQISSRPLVTILPGSRNQELQHNLPAFLDAARHVKQQLPEVRFAVACVHEQHREWAERLAHEAGVEVEIFAGRTPELIHLATCCMACSGSVSLELLFHTKPSVILYTISRSAYFLQSLVRQVKYITLVNLLAADDAFRREPYDPDAPGATEVPLPEYLTCEDKSRAIANRITRWLRDDEQRTRRVAWLRELKQQFAHGGASATAAEYIFRQLGGAAAPIPRPHFRARQAGQPAPRKNN